MWRSSVAFAASTSDGGGYWFFTNTGQEYQAGDAVQDGGLKTPPNKPIVGGTGFGELNTGNC